MKLILFAHQDSAAKGENLKKLINQNLKNIQLQTFQTFHAFKKRLEQLSFYDQEIFVLLADSENRLKKLALLIDFLQDKRIILILPDDSKAILLIAYKFFPRFFTYINDNYDDLCAVLIKMINHGKNTNELK